MQYGQGQSRRRIGRRRADALMRWYLEIEAERAQAVANVRACRDGCGADDDVDLVAAMWASRMNRIVHHRTEVGDALDRLAAGGYGVCETCGKQIPAARLEANPAAIRCVGCQEQAEGRGTA